MIKKTKYLSARHVLTTSGIVPTLGGVFFHVHREMEEQRMLIRRMLGSWTLDTLLLQSTFGPCSLAAPINSDAFSMEEVIIIEGFLAH